MRCYTSLVFSAWAENVARKRENWIDYFPFSESLGEESIGDRRENSCVFS